MVIITTKHAIPLTGVIYLWNLNAHSMSYQRKKPIPENQQRVLFVIGKKVRELRKSKGLSVEKFCSKYNLARIAYTNLEAGQNFHMTTLLTIIDCHPEVGSLKNFFQDI